MTVAALLASTSSRELSEWYAYFRLVAADRQERELAAKAVGGLRARKTQRRRSRRG